MKLTRKRFIQACGSGVAFLSLGSFFVPELLAEESDPSRTASRNDYGILVDTSRCVGCKECQIACMKAHNLPVNENATFLGPTALSIVDMHKVSTEGGKAQIQPVKRQCMNCVNPSCVSACTVGALHKRPDGPVVYDTERCIGCRYCMYACPFGVPTFEWEKRFSVMRKCDGCVQRIDQGKIPACAEACPQEALVYGLRQDILKIAHERIRQGKGNIIDHIYGESEIGGTSRIYLATISFEKLGFPTLSETAPAKINEKIMHSTPTIAATAIISLSAIHWLITTRDKLMKEHADDDSPREVK